MPRGGGLPARQVEQALAGLRTAAALVSGENAWQIQYHMALLLEARAALCLALSPISGPFRPQLLPTASFRPLPAHFGPPAEPAAGQTF